MCPIVIFNVGLGFSCAPFIFEQLSGWGCAKCLLLMLAGSSCAQFVFEMLSGFNCAQLLVLIVSGFNCAQFIYEIMSGFNRAQRNRNNTLKKQNHRQHQKQQKIGTTRSRPNFKYKLGTTRPRHNFNYNLGTLRLAKINHKELAQLDPDKGSNIIWAHLTP